MALELPFAQTVLATAPRFGLEASRTGVFEAAGRRWGDSALSQSGSRRGMIHVWQLILFAPLNRKD